MKLITTSWDDGHILDFKLAELLNKYNLPGTFYIPKTNAEHQVMEAAQIVELAKQFEIGGHTMHHTRLRMKNRQQIDAEVLGCFNWLHNLLGYPPVSFCFPGGIFSPESIASVYESGFKVARTTELLSIDKQVAHRLVPTTLQVYDHSAFTYFKHLVKRQHWQNMARWLSSNSLYNLQILTEDYLKRIETSGGCFHLWGHSWEMEEYQLWNKLEKIFETISNRPNFTYIPNKGLAVSCEL